MYIITIIFIHNRVMDQKNIEMLGLQDDMNTLISGPDWRKWITNKWKAINWRRCIYMELIEAIDSLPWKHWKSIDADIDIENFKVEIVDIWHFILSELLTYYSYEAANELIKKSMWWSSITYLPKKWESDASMNIDAILKPYEDLIRVSLESSNKETLTKLLQIFFICLDSTKLSYKELSSLYIWKNVLNGFRQNNGYKEGKYVKIWNWVEDNVIMQEILSKNENISYDEIYKELEKYYDQQVIK